MIISINIVPKERKPFRIKDVPLERIKDAGKCEFAIIEHGTESGATSLVMILHDAEGNAHIAEFTGNQFEGLAAAFMGAKLRFGK